MYGRLARRLIRRSARGARLGARRSHRAKFESTLRRILRLEPLEERVLLAVTAFSSGSVLKIDLSGANEFVSIAHNVNRYEITHAGGGRIIVPDAGITGFEIEGDGSSGQQVTLGQAPAVLPGNLHLNDVADIDVTGDYRVSGTVDISLSPFGGSITDSTGSLVVSGATTIAAGGAGDVTLDAPANDFRSMAFSSVRHVTLFDRTELSLGASSIGGDLRVVALDTISDSGPLSVAGTMTLATHNDSGAAIRINEPASSFGAIRAHSFKADGVTPSAGSIVFFENAPMDLAAVTTTGLASFVAAGMITDSGSIVVEQTASFATLGAGHAITLDGGLQTGVIGATTSDAPILLTAFDSVEIAATGLNAGTARIELASGIFVLPGPDRIGDSSSLLVSGGAALDMASHDETVSSVQVADGGIRGTGSLTATAAANAFHLQSGRVDAVLSGATADVLKDTTGTVILSSVNTYGGRTTINAGRLRVDGATPASSRVTVNGGGVLAGSGLVAGPVSVALGGTISPGNSPGRLATGNLDFASGARFAAEVNGSSAGSGHDQLDVQGTVNLGNATLNITGTSGPFGGQQIVLIDNDGADPVVGRFAGRAEGSTVSVNGVAFVLSYQGGSGGNDVVLTPSGVFHVSDFDGRADEFTVRGSGNNLQVLNGTTVVVSQPFAAVTSVTIDGEDGQDDTLTVDVAGFPASFSGEILFNGGSGANDVLLLVDPSGSPFGRVTHRFDGPASGAILVDRDGSGGNGPFRIEHRDPEVLSDSLLATDRVFDFGGGAETITLRDAPGPHNTLDSTLSQSVTFANPLSSLTVNAGGGSDTINIQGLDADGPFSADLVLDGGSALDRVNFHVRNTDLGGGGLNASAEQINVEQQVTAGAEVDLHGADRVAVRANLTAGSSLTMRNVNVAELGAGAALLASGGDVDLSGAGRVELSGTGTSAITSRGGSVTLSNVSDHGSAAGLSILADDHVLLGSVVLEGNTSGLLDIQVDADGDGGLFDSGHLTAGEIEVSSNSSITIGANDVLTATRPDGLLRISAVESGAGQTENLFVQGGAVLRVTGDRGAIRLDAGEDVSIAAGATIGDIIRQDDAIRIAGDWDSNDLSGSTINLSGRIHGATLQVLGNSGPDVLRLIESSGNPLPNLAGDARLLPADPGHDNAAFLNSISSPNAVGAHFEASAGGDSLEVTTVLSAYTVSYYSDDHEANSGVINIDGQLTMSFDGLTPQSFTSLAGGTLTVDATSTPATSRLTVEDAGAANDGVNRITGDGGFEATTFAGFSNLIVRGGTGPETITVISLDAADPDGVAAGGRALTSITLDGDNSLGPGATGNDFADDVLMIHRLPAAVTAVLLGGQDAPDGGLGDTFRLSSSNSGLGTVDQIAGQVIVSPPVDERGTASDLLEIEDRDDPSSDTAIVVTPTTVDGITGHTAGADVIYGSLSGELVESIVINTSNAGGGGDIVNVRGTRAGSVYSVNSGAGDDVVNLGHTAPVQATGSLDEINGQLRVSTGPGNDVLDISDRGATAGDSYRLATDLGTTQLAFQDGQAGTDVVYNSAGSLDLEHFILSGATAGANRFEVQATTATVSNTINDGVLGASNSGAFEIQADRLQAGASNQFHGFDGSDNFAIDFGRNNSIPTAANTSLVVNGGSPAFNSGDRDTVTIRAAADTLPRSLEFRYAGAASGDVDVAGLGTASVLDMNSIETLFYEGDASNDDAIRVVGTALSDELTVAPLAIDEALVFRGGDPWDGPADGDFFAHLPGVAGGSAGPDLRLDGLAAASGLTISGGGGGANRLFVYGSSETSLRDPSTSENALGFGSGVLMPASASAQDEILLTDSSIRFVDDASRPAASALDQRVRTNLATATFLQPVSPVRTYGIVLNAGFESAVGPDGIADDITATLSARLPLLVNGGEPSPAGAPLGDRLNMSSSTDLKIGADKSGTPLITTSAGGTQPLDFSSIETALLTPRNGVVNIVGDNDMPGVDQNDEFVIVGRDTDGDPSDGGVGEFTLQINGSPPIAFNGVTQINARGWDSTTPTDPSTAAANLDTLDISPYADSSPRGWGIAVDFDEGFPTATDADAAAADLIIYRTGSAGGAVSEQIVVQPASPLAGEIRATNAATGTPITTIRYRNNLDLQFRDEDGFTTDTDRIEFRGTAPGGPGTSGLETAILDTSAAGTAAAPLLSVADGTTTLYRVQQAINFDTLVLDLDGGDDLTRLAGRGAVDEVQFIDLGGNRGGSFRLEFRGQTTADIDLSSAEDLRAKLRLLSAIDDVTVTAVTGGYLVGFSGPNVRGRSHPNLRLLNGSLPPVPWGAAALDVETVTDGGVPTLNIAGSGGNDRLLVTGTRDANDSYAFVPGDVVGSGLLTFSVGGSAVSNVVNFTGHQQLEVDGGGGTGHDELSVHGTAAANTFTLTGTDTVAGEVSVDAYTKLVFRALGTGGAGSETSEIHLHGLGGHDTFALEHVADWQLEHVNVSAGSGNDVVEIAGTPLNDAITFTPSAVDAADVGLTVGATATTYRLTGLESVSLDGRAPAGDSLMTTTLGTYVHTPAGPGAGSVRVDGNLPLSYEQVETVSYVGSALVVAATPGNDIVTLTATTLTVNGNSIDVSGFTAPGSSLVLDLMGGADRLDISPSRTLFPGGATIVAIAQDTVAVTADPGRTAQLDLADGTLTGIVAGPIALTSAGTLNGTGSNGGVADRFRIVGFGASSTLTSVNLNGGDTDGTADGDTIEIMLAAGNNTTQFEPLTRRSGVLSASGGSTRVHITGLNEDPTTGQLTLDGSRGSSDELVLVGSPAADTVTAKQSGLLTELISSGTGPRLPIAFSQFEGLTVKGLSGADQLRIDEGSAPSLIPLRDGVVFDGGSGFDTLRLSGSGALDSASYQVGPDATSGRIVHKHGGVTQRVSFHGLEPVIDTTPGPLIVHGTAAGNAINYSQLTPLRGRIQVDQFEHLEFENKSTVTINADAGADTINVNNTTAGLGGTLFIEGGDPADGDRLIVSGLASTVNVDPTNGLISGAGPAAVAYRGLESVLVDGSSSTSPTPLGLSGAGAYVFVPGATNDSGQFQTGSGTVDFAGIPPGRAILVSGTAGVAEQLTVQGTPGADTFSIVRGDSLQLDGRARLALSELDAVSINTLAGDDRLHVTPHDTVSFQINGGDASTADHLTVTGTGAADVIRLNLETQSISVAPLLPIQFAAVEDLLIDPLAGADVVEIHQLGTVSSLRTVGTTINTEDVTIFGTPRDDTFAVTPLTATEVTLSANSQGPQVSAKGVGLVTVDGRGQSDAILVNGTAGDDLVFADGGHVSLIDSTAVSRKAIHYVAEALTLNGRSGRDLFTVTASQVPVHIDGGGPIGGQGDSLSVTAAVAVMVSPGPAADEGSVLVVGQEPISFDRMEGLTISATSPAGATVQAGDGVDAIAVAADDRPGLPSPGVRDFTVSINNGLEMLFADTPAISIAARNGSDEISVRAPAPNRARWGVQVAIDGGTPAASDRLVVETPGRDSARYQAAAATLELDHDQDSVFDSTITFRQIEELVYDGQRGNDTLIVAGTSGPDEIMHAVAAVDRGQFAINGLLPIEYEDLGAAGELSVEGGAAQDRLLRTGTVGHDRFHVGATIGGELVHLDGFLPLTSLDVERLSLDGGQGADHFVVEATSRFDLVDVDGGAAGPEGDTLAIVGARGVDERFEVSHVGLGAGLVRDSISADEVRYASVERLSVTGHGREDRLQVADTQADDQLSLVRGPTGDQLIGSTQIPVDILGSFESLTVDVSAASGNDTLTIDATRLRSAERYSISADPDEIDRLILLGTESRDVVRSTDTTVTIAEGANSNTVQFAPGELDLITILTLGGNDKVSLTGLAEPKWIEAGGGNDYVNMSASVDGFVFGGAGDDILIGSAAADFLDGGPGSDALFGLGANDQLVGGPGDDWLVGGAGRDTNAGDAGSDTFVWNPGDESDVFEGGLGLDLLQVTGGSVGDSFKVGAQGSRLSVERQPGNVMLDAAGVERLEANASVTFVQALTGAAANPPVATAASGTVLATYHDTAGTLDLRVLVDGISPIELSGADLRLVSSGASVLSLGDGAGWTGEHGGLRRELRGARLPAASIGELLAGRVYLDVRTAVHPGGELRGQLLPAGASANLNGPDTFVVYDLSLTELAALTIGLGPHDLAELDRVTIHGTNGDDTVTIHAADNVQVTGLAYDVSVARANVGEDQLTFAAASGHDSVLAAGSLDRAFAAEDLSISGGAGNDLLSGYGALLGDAGDDVLRGSEVSQLIRGGSGADELWGAGGDDRLFGDAGDDVLDGGQGHDMLDGGSDFDRVLITGTPFDDVIDVAQTSAEDLRFTVNADTQHDALVAGTLEQAWIAAGTGADLIRAVINDQLFDDAGLSLQMMVDGGSATGLGDRLLIVDDGLDDLSLWRKGVSGDAGSMTVGPGNPEPFEHLYEGIERLQVVDESGTPLNAGSGDAARLVVFEPDEFEFNDDRFTATLLAANTTVDVVTTIDPAGLRDPFGTGTSVPGDSDWYRIDAQTTGTLDVRVHFEEVAALAHRPGLPGNGNLDIELFDADGTLVAGQGAFGDNDGLGELDADGDGFAENERIRIPAVAGQTYYLRVFGASTEVVNRYGITVINGAPPAPFEIELQDAAVGGSDTGRSRFDNLTRDPTPSLQLRLDDSEFRFDHPGGSPSNRPFDQFIEMPFQTVSTAPGFRIAIFDEGATPGQAVTSPVGFAEQVAGAPGLYTFTFPSPLGEGSHFISARVEMIDPAVPATSGFGPRSLSQEIVIDTTPPPVSFGSPTIAEDGLDPGGSDTGVPGRLGLFRDRITSHTTPTLWGQAEAAAIVRVFADQNGDGFVDAGDVLLGSTLAAASGTGQTAPAQWRLQTTVDLNDPGFFSRDGVRRLLVNAEDEAGSVSAAERLVIFVDTQGPRITRVDVNQRHLDVNDDGLDDLTGEPVYDLFDPQPSTDGPTPRIDSLAISVQDLGPRSDLNLGFLYDVLEPSLAAEPAHVSLVGDQNGVIAIAALTFVSDARADGQFATGGIHLEFFAPLPDDRYTLVLADNLVDPANNRLDGDSNASQPQGPWLPSGDGVNGGPFRARFTVDSRPEIGTVCCGAGVRVDINGNLVFDPEGQDNDATNRDLVFQFGLDRDEFFAGDFSPAGSPKSSGFDKLGVFGVNNAVARFVLDFDHDGAEDFISVVEVLDSEFSIDTALPVAGDFNASKPGDEIGLLHVKPVTGRLIADWFLDVDGDNVLEAQDGFIRIDAATYPELGELFRTDAFASEKVFPVVGDFDGNGTDDLAIFDGHNNLFHFDLDRDGSRDDVVEFGFANTPDPARIAPIERAVAGDLNLDGIDDLGIFSPNLGVPQPPLGQPGAGNQPSDDTAQWRFLLSDQPGLLLPRQIFGAFAPAPLGNDLSAEFGNAVELPVFGNFDPPVAAAGSPPAPVATPYRNFGQPLDVDRNDVVAPRDALLVINALNSYGSGPLPEAVRGDSQYMPPQVYLDASGDGFVAPRDALLVIDFLSRAEFRVDGQAEGESDAVGKPQIWQSMTGFVGHSLSSHGFDLRREQPPAGRETGSRSGRAAAEGPGPRHSSDLSGLRRCSTSSGGRQAGFRSGLAGAWDEPDGTLEQIMKDLESMLAGRASAQPVDEVFRDWQG